MGGSNGACCCGSEGGCGVGVSTPVVSREAWVTARKALLEKEKALTRAMDEVSEARRALPRVLVEKEYVFETGCGKKTLSELFAGRSQLIVYHFMLAPGQEEGCTGCSFLCDHVDGPLAHLVNHDVMLVAASRAPLAEIERYKARMGWKFPWVSSGGSDFNYDYHVTATKAELARGKMYYNYEEIDVPCEDLHGLSVFYKDEAGRIYHTYSTYARGGDILIGAHHFLDLTPRGRNEESTMSWVRRRDEYAGGVGCEV